MLVPQAHCNFKYISCAAGTLPAFAHKFVLGGKLPKTVATWDCLLRRGVRRSQTQHTLCCSEPDASPAGFCCLMFRLNQPEARVIGREYQENISGESDLMAITSLAVQRESIYKNTERSTVLGALPANMALDHRVHIWGGLIIALRITMTDLQKNANCVRIYVNLGQTVGTER